MKKITYYIVAILLFSTAKISHAQEWTPVFNFNSPNGQIATSNGDKVFTYQPYIYLNQTHYAAMLSLDNGNTWTQVHDEKFAAAFFNTQEDLYAVRQDNNYPGTNFYYPQSIFLTEDNGSSWTTIDTVADNIGQVNASVFRMDNSGTLYIAFRDFNANTGGFKYSTDDGANWTLIPTFIAGQYDYKDIYSALLSSSGDFFITTYNQGVFKSSDAGENWARVYESFITLAFLNEHPATGDLYVASYGSILKSTDGGENWEVIDPDPWMAMNIKEFEITEDGTFYFANSGGVYKSSDCVHWEQIWTPNAKYLSAGVIDMAINDNYVYVSTTDSTVYRQSRQTTGIDDNKISSYLNIYPNPANDYVTISINHTNLNKTEQTLIISDVSGKTVYNSVLASDIRISKIDISNLNTGFYTVSIISESSILNQKLVVSK